MNVDQLRELLPVTLDFIYMNTGWAGPTPTSVLHRIAETLEQEARVGPASSRGVALGREVDNEARAAVASALNAGEEDVTITHSTREGVNVVLYGMDWQPGDEILICDLEHPALTSPAGVLSQRMGVEVNSVSIPVLSQQSEALALVASAMSERTKLVALSHIQYTCGLRLPIKEITSAAHEMGIPVLVDGAQSFGQVDVNVSDLGCDFFALSGQKWLMGPVGTGALYVSPERRDMLEPLFSTNALESGRENTQRRHLARFSLVSQSPGLVAGFSESLRLAADTGISQIEQRTMSLSNLLRERVTTLGGCNLLSPTSPGSACGLVTVGLDGWPPEELVTALQERFGIVARTVHGPDGVRFSTHFFNTTSEVEKVAEVLERLATEGYQTPA
ncbi:MAG: aminotransferase class V-fold PLP-dependent enzyme [Dehalococcoidia bacterium]|jgi:L-cysteine/cystine lyase|nr:aminotransferase class V-fold PLP-dependent enzyme [Dehalococcoidia bacterium]